MSLSKTDLVVKCSEMTERLMRAAGLVALSDDIAATLSASLPGKKTVEFHDDKKKFQALLVASDTTEAHEQYRIKVSLDPANGKVKLDTFYIVDPGQRGNGLGKAGLRNIYDLARQEEKIREIELTATLDNGAYVWAKMGFKPLEADFRRFQIAARERLHQLQEELPGHAKIERDIFDMTDRLLDHEKTKDPRAIWALADMGVSVPYSYNEDRRLVERPKKLSFVLMEWMEYRAKLDLGNPEQVARLEEALGPAPARMMRYPDRDLPKQSPPSINMEKEVSFDPREP